HLLGETGKRRKLLADARRADEGALADARLQIAAVGQVAQRMARRHAAHAEFLGKHALGSDLLSDLEGAVQNIAFYPVCDAPVDRRVLAHDRRSVPLRSRPLLTVVYTNIMTAGAAPVKSRRRISGLSACECFCLAGGGAEPPACGRAGKAHKP